MRWVQPNTVVQDLYNPIDLDPYAYVRNNPVNFNDPSGHDADCASTDNECKAQVQAEKALYELYKNSKDWQASKLSFEEFLRGYDAYYYYMSHPGEALQAHLEDLNSIGESDYYWADMFSQYVLNSTFQPYGDDLAIQQAEKAALFGDEKTYWTLIFALGIEQFYFDRAADKGFGGGGGPNFTKKMLSESEIIAQGPNIREVDQLVKVYGGDIKGWKKMKGWDENGQEWHWYYHSDVGRVKIKPK